MTYVKVPVALAERNRRSTEAGRIRHAKGRAELRYVDTRRVHHEERRFVCWDGEGPRDAGYALFGNSDGDEICHPFIGTTEALDLMIAHKRANPNTIDVWFGGDYDTSMILADLPDRHMIALAEYNRTVWGEYVLEHIPHKWFKISHGGITVTMFDIHSFFDSGYVGALEDWEIGDPWLRLAISSGKARRSEFVWAEIESIRYYWRLELFLMPYMCEKLRTVFADAGYVPRSWHGPGALARMALSRHKVYDAMADVPEAVAKATRSAFAGGRFELKWAGYFRARIYNYDIHSAYPYFATFLPNLSRGKWRKTSHYEEGKFAVYRIRYEDENPDVFKLYPLFRRLPNTGVAWPYRVTGWYWAPEADLVKDDPNAEILEGWVFDEDDPADRPFAWLAEYYDRRRRLQKAGSAAEYTFKLIINAVYGQLAQRVGWNRKDGTPPRTHQLEWAGFITSSCRAAVYRAAQIAGDKVISIDTDGLYSLCPIETLELGDKLGQWDLKEYDDGVFWQSGVYYLKEGDEWKKAKTRGIPKGTYTAEDLLARVKTRESFSVQKNVFVGYRMAANGQWEKINSWEEKTIEFVFGGGGKRSHIGRFGRCNTACNGNVHALGQISFLYGPNGDPESKPHYLPWLDNEEETTEIKEYGHFVVSEEDPDSEELGWTKTPTGWRQEWQPPSKIRIRQKGKTASAVAKPISLLRKLGFRFSRPTG
jgi:hypothetical protein